MWFKLHVSHKSKQLRLTTFYYLHTDKAEHKPYFLLWAGSCGTTKPSIHNLKTMGYKPHCLLWAWPYGTTNPSKHTVKSMHLPHTWCINITDCRLWYTILQICLGWAWANPTLISSCWTVVRLSRFRKIMLRNMAYPPYLVHTINHHTKNMQNMRWKIPSTPNKGSLYQPSHNEYNT